MPNFINQGKFAIIREGELRAYLQTCSGLIYHALGIVGFAHSSIPSEYRHFYDNMHLELTDAQENLLVTPTQAAEKLLEEMTKQGVAKKELKAHLFGCRMEETDLGKKNADEAKLILERLEIPIGYNFTNLPYDTDLTMTPEQIRVKLTNCPFSKQDLERIIKLD